MRNAVILSAALLALGCTSLLDDVSGGSDGTGTHPPTVGPNPLDQQQIDAFVSAHNAARRSALNPPPSPALPPVSWDAALAQSAYNYLIECVPNGSLVAHNANRSGDYQALGGSGYVGENIYAASGKDATPQAAVDGWMSEASAYDYNANNEDATTGHYTQVVWRDSVRIGCAIVTCSAIKFPNTVLCDYAPGGNIVGERPY
jgi:pathogenesis-related protein 1